MTDGKRNESSEKGLTRREFLKTSAAATAALSVGSLGVFGHADADAIGPDDTINAALIGTGSQGCHLLRRGIKVANVNWTACCDIQEKNLNRGLEIAKGAKGYEDYRELLDRKDIQAVVIATPIYLHSQMTVDALRSGKHVLCEKMMAYSVGEAKHMFRVARQTGRRLQIGHQRRYNPRYQHAYHMVKDGILGNITHVRAQWNRNGSWRRPCPDPNLDKLVNWRLYSDRSQGLMAELGSHQMDVVNWMLDETPNAVMGVGALDYWKDGRDIFDNVQAIFEYPSGVKVQYQSLTTNQHDGFTEQIMGDKGTLILSPGKALLFPEPKSEEIAWADTAKKEEVQGKKAIILDASKSPRWQKTKTEGTVVGGKEDLGKDDYLLELEDFFRSIRDGHQPLCDKRVALDTCIACIKANEAMGARTRLEIPADLYRV